MSAILSSADLNDFISPSVACIKPVETLPAALEAPSNPYEVTTEESLAASAPPPPASISLTDCLACSGCVTSAEAVLVSLQSYQEVISTLDAFAEIALPRTRDEAAWAGLGEKDGKVYVATVSPQARASVAATFVVSEKAAGNMIERLLSGEEGLRGTGNGAGFSWVLDSNVLREVALVGAVEEVERSKSSAAQGDYTQRVSAPKKPILTSACPGWICYAEKTHPHVLPHISKLKSPQAIAGTLVKTILASKGIPPEKVFHVAVMPCFDKKLEASREEFTSSYWDSSDPTSSSRGARDVDLVITSRELISLASSRGISFPSLSHRPLSRTARPPFPDQHLESFLFPPRPLRNGSPDQGSSGGYLYHVLRTTQLLNPGSHLSIQRGRNADVVEYVLTASSLSTNGSTMTNGTHPSPASAQPDILMRAARYYGFRNIQNLVRRLRPAKTSRLPGAARAGVRRPNGAAGTKQEVGVEGYDYVEVMACPGGCTNGGGQVKVGDVRELRGEMKGTGEGDLETDVGGQREWLGVVDEAYFSGGTSDGEEERDGDGDMVMEETGEEGDDLVVDGVSRGKVKGFVDRWEEFTGIERERLLYTTYRKVESDVGKKASDVERVAGLASSIGGGW
ncbi:iron hydrogenase [Elsinoe ampelina]|uniref:Nuclear architecture-related protein 1 n=1 Tax=Elsinoe ampelina TaxID=302913 RepID=A0A6A6GBM8_9PEZI|nr:iron hydrogenase [Elsinoe ampelina]